MTTNEILDILFDPESSDSEFDDETIDVIFELPKETAFAESNEDSDHSNSEATGDQNHLPRGILLSAGTLQGISSSELRNDTFSSGSTQFKIGKKKDRQWQRNFTDVA